MWIQAGRQAGFSFLSQVLELCEEEEEKKEVKAEMT